VNANPEQCNGSKEVGQANNTGSIAASAPVVKSSRAGSSAGWIARHELWLLALATPLLLFSGPWSLAGLVLILLAWLARWVDSRRLTASTGLEPPIALLIVAGLVGCAVAPDLARSQAALGRLLLGLAWFYGLANLETSAAWLRRLSWLWIIASAGLLLLAITGTDWQNTRLLPLAIYDRIPQWSWNVQSGALANARGVGMAVAMTIPLLLALALLGRARAQRLVALLLAALLTAVLLLTQSLQGALGLALGVAVLLALWSRWTWLLALPLAGAAVWAIGRLDLPALALSALDIQNAAGIGVVLRLDIWSRALAMLADMPLTGIGLDSYLALQSQFYPGHLLGPEIHAHNLALQLGLDLGIAGLLAFAWLLAAFAAITLKALRRSPQPEERALVAGTAAGVAAMLGSGLIDSIWTLKPALLFWLLLGTGVIAARAMAQRSLPPARLAWAARGHTAAGALIAVIWLALALSPGIWQTNQGLLHAHQALLTARTTGVADIEALQQARDQLLASAASKPGDPQVYDTLASLQAWLGENDAALATLRQRLAMDSGAPMERYAPWEPWRRRLLAEDGPGAAVDLTKVYSQWMVRYPDRAEGYVRVALLAERWQGDRTRAAAVLQEGLKQGAQPAGLLTAALAQIDR
jgi:putative inorganic carbon (HCO3(-)) transporter